MKKKKRKQVSAAQLAALLGITRQGVRKAIIEGRIKHAKKIGKQWVIEI